MPDTCSETVLATGVDGCRSGWIAVSWDGKTLSGKLYGTLNDMTAEMAVDMAPDMAAARMLVDIPIGLTNGSRELDGLARRMSSRPSSIFPVPCRAAVYADSYAQASAVNFQHTGKKISRQSWNICSKIREMDELLRRDPSLRERIWESHPELSFELLAGEPLVHSKKTREGEAERTAILRQVLPDIDDLFATLLGQHRRSELARDDILDAAVLCLVASTGTSTATVSLHGSVREDDQGIPIRMCLPKSLLAAV